MQVKCKEIPEGQTEQCYLQGIWCVFQAVYFDTVFQRSTKGGGKDGELESLDGRPGVGLSHEDVCPKLVQQNMAALRFQLAVAGRV